MDRSFPHNPESIVLSSIMRNPQMIYNIKSLKPHMFARVQHEALFRVFMTLFDSGIQPEFSLVVSTLQSERKLEEVGGDSYLSYLMSVPEYPDADFSHCIDIIRESYKTRKFLGIKTAFNDEFITSRSIDAVIDFVRGALDGISFETGGEFTKIIGSIVKSSVSSILARVKNPGIRGVKTGLIDVDSATMGLNPGNFWIIAGRPGQGKSALACNIALNISESYVPVLIFSKEMSIESLFDRFLSIKSNIPLTDIRSGLLNPKQVLAVQEKSSELGALNIFIDSNFSADIFYVESVIRRYVKMYDVKVIIVDYIQLLSERDENQTQELGRISKKFKLLAEELKISIIALSQLNRDVEHRENKRPQLSDLRQCGNLEEDADIVVGLYREAYYNAETKNKNGLEFILLKQRDGRVGVIMLEFTPETVKISNS